MGTKSNPGKFDCYKAAEEDEPVFILLARDPDAPVAIEAWADIRDTRKGVTERTKQARAIANDMRAWRINNGG